MARNTQPIRIRILFSVLTALIILGLVEAGSRLYDYLVYFPRIEEALASGVDVDVSLTQEYCFRLGTCERDADMIWRMRPHAGTPWFQLNGLGIRGAEIPETKPSNEFRIVVVGGSHPFGIGVKDDEIYSAYLQRILEERWPDTPKRFRVINAALPGFTSFQARRLIERDPYDLKADLYLLDVGLNDSSVVWSQSDSELGSLTRFETWLTNLAYHISLFWNVKHAIELLRGGSQRDLVRRCTDEETRENLKAMQTAAMSQNAKAVFLSQMMVENLGIVRDVRRRSERFPEKPRLLDPLPDIDFEPTIDVFQVFKSREADLEHLLLDGCHGSPAGHRLIARTLMEFLRDNEAWLFSGREGGQ